MTCRWLTDRTEALARACGIWTAVHSGVSFRRGGATSYRRAGLSDREVQVLGRWKGSAYQRYLAENPESISAAASSALAAQHQ